MFRGIGFNSSNYIRILRVKSWYKNIIVNYRQKVEISLGVIMKFLKSVRQQVWKKSTRMVTSINQSKETTPKTASCCAGQTKQFEFLRSTGLRITLSCQFAVLSNKNPERTLSQFWKSWTLRFKAENYAFAVQITIFMVSSIQTPCFCQNGGYHH